MTDVLDKFLQSAITQTFGKIIIALGSGTVVFYGLGFIILHAYVDIERLEGMIDFTSEYYAEAGGRFLFVAIWRPMENWVFTLPYSILLSAMVGSIWKYYSQKKDIIKKADLWTIFWKISSSCSLLLLSVLIVLLTIAPLYSGPVIFMNVLVDNFYWLLPSLFYNDPSELNTRMEFIKQVETDYFSLVSPLIIIYCVLLYFIFVYEKEIFKEKIFLFLLIIYLLFESPLVL